MNIGITIPTLDTLPVPDVLHVNPADLTKPHHLLPPDMFVVQFDSTDWSTDRIRSLGLSAVAEDVRVAPPVAGHLTVGALQTILLHPRHPPDQLPAGLAEGQLREVVLHELVAPDRETSCDLVASFKDVFRLNL